MAGAAATAPPPAPPAQGGQTPRQYDVDFWNGSSGLRQSRIRAIVQTRDGYIWLGSDNGLVRFDGVNFTTFNMQSGNLKDNEVTSLAEDVAGTLWIGTYGGGLTRCKNGRFTTYTTADGLPEDIIGLVDYDSAGNVWCTTPNGVCRFSQGKFKTFTTKDGLPNNSITVFCARSREGVFVADEDKIFHFDGGRFEPIKGFRTGRYDWVDHLTCGKDGALLAFFKEGFIQRLKGNHWDTQRLGGGFKTRVHCAYEAPNGTIWISSREGLFKVDEEKVEPIIPADQQARMGVICTFCVDAEGSFWTGLEANGLARVRRTRLTSISTEQGLPEGRVMAVFEDSRGDLWIALQEGLVRYRNGVATRYMQYENRELSFYATALGEDRNGVVWVGCGKYMYQILGDQLRRDQSWNEPDDIRVIYRDPTGLLWIGTDGGGLYEMNGGAPRRYRAKDGLASDRILDLHCDRQGALWVATSGGGLSRLTGGKITNFTERDGLGSRHVLDIHEDSDGMLWFATRGGLTLYKNGRFHNFGPREGIDCIYVHSLESDGLGSLWLGSAQGLIQLNRRELDLLAEGQIAKVTARHFGMADGMKALSCNVGNQPLACRTRDGRVLFATFRGVAVADSRNIMFNRMTPPVHIESIDIDGHILPPGQHAVVPPGRGTVEINYTALSFLNTSRVIFRYRLEGFDEKWVDAGTRRFAYYANLPAGQYQFQVIARNADGTWNRVGESFSFELRPHFHETAWFYALCVAGLLLLTYAIHELRIRRHMAHELELQARVEDALANVKVLSGLLPICANCKKVRDDQGYWNSIEQYLTQHSDTMISHGICPDCVRELYPEIATEVLKSKKAS